MAEGHVIYLDNAATTPMKQEVLDAMLPFFCQEYGNPSSPYDLADVPREAIRKARQTAADSIGAECEDIYFTSGGSEGDNWALKGVAEANKGKGRHIITTKIEHHAVLNTCTWLELHGYDVTYLDVDSEGLVAPEQVEEAIRDDTILISVMFANNEIGTIEPIAPIGEIAKRHGVLFHTDAVQAYGHIPIDVNECNIDLLTTSAHKLNGPKGTGFLYIRSGTPISQLIWGGAQERDRRAGTENVPGIVGFGKAIELAMRDMKANANDIAMKRDYLAYRISNEIPDFYYNGPYDTSKRLPNNAHFCFGGIESESLLMLLNEAGIYASSTSACMSGSLLPSHVLLAVGYTPELANGALRMTLSEDISLDDVRYVAEVLKDSIQRLRESSPNYKE